MNGGATAWAITPEERGKHDKQFDTLAPVLGYVSGEQARKFFLQSGLPPSVLAEIWNLADMDSDGKMDRQEFSIAMKLIKLKLQGRNLPSVLPITMKQPPVANSAPTIPSSARFGMGSMPNLSVGLSSMSAMSAMPILTPIPVNPSMHSVPTLVPTPMTLPLITSLGNSGLPNGNVNLLTPPFIPNNTVLPLSGFSSPMAFSPSTGMSKANSLLDLGSSSSNSSSTTSLASNSPKTGASDWAVPQSSRLKYRQQFNTLDKLMSGYLSGPQVRNALIASNLTQTQLATIWTLADVDKDGQLQADEFILAMHLVDMAKTGRPLPLTLPQDLVPPSLRGGTKPSELVNGTGPYTTPCLLDTPEIEPAQKPKSSVSFEDKLKENFARGSAELEKRRLALEEEQRKERERREREEREAHERREREAREQENRRRLEEERRLERQREMERQREEERLRELERKEAAKQEMERQRREEWERGKREELGRRREGEQEEISRLRAKKKSLELELEAVGNKHKQISDRLRDAQSKRRILKAEVDLVNQKRDSRIVEINTLQLQFEDWQRKLSQLVPEQQRLTEKLRNINLNKIPSVTLTSLTGSVTEKGVNCRRLKDQLDTLERETTDKLAQMEQYNKELKELREKQVRQQAVLDDLHRVKEEKLRELQRRREEETERRRREEEEAARQAKLEQERREKEKREEEEARQRRLLEEQRARQREEEEREAQARLRAAQEKAQEEERRRREEEEEEKRKREEEEERKRKEEEEERRKKEEQEREGQKQPVLVAQKSLKLTTYRALYSFVARNADELSIDADGLIEVDEQTVGEPGWLCGSYRGNKGWFPQSYAEKCPKPSATETGPSSPGKMSCALPPPLNTGVPDGEVACDSTAPAQSDASQSSVPLLARAVSSWSATSETHLNLSSGAGDVITALLSFSQGDIISVLQQRDDWWLGQLNGTQGWFPKSYVTLETGGNTEVDAFDTTDSVQLEEYVALYTYESPEAGDLTFVEGDVVMVTEREGEWWRGCIGDQTGVFPSNYVRPVEPEASKPGAPVKKPEIAQAVTTAVAPTMHQLRLSPGQLIVVLAKNSTGWWLGELQARGKKRQRGWFHSSHVKLLGPSSSKSSPSPLPVCQVIAMYDYTAANRDELSFSKGQLINILDKTNPDWWKGEANGVLGLLPTNYVKMTTESDPSQQCTVDSSSMSEHGETDGCADLMTLDTMTPQERKRQGYIHELIQTEETYVDDLELVLDVFYKPMSESGRLTEAEMGVIFVNWRELIMCNTKLLKALRVRKKTEGENMPVQLIGDLLASELAHMQPYIRFCSCQLNAAALLQSKTHNQPDFKDFLKKIATNYRCKGMPLSSFLLKPMQRITRYPLLIKNILEHTPDGHADRSPLREALERAEELCSQVNEGVREKENSDRLEWIQSHVQCEGAIEHLVFNSLTNCLGPRKLLHSGRLYKTKSSRELWAFLFSDFLLLTHSAKPFSSSGPDKLFSLKTNIQLKMYKTPLFLNEVLVKMPPDPSSDEPLFHVSHIDRVYTLKTETLNERTTWVQKIKAASEHFIETEKKKREKAYQARSLKSSGIGRLLVTVTEAQELKACKPNGKSNPYCELTMGAQCYTSRPISDTLNPKWNFNCQFFIKDLYQDVLCITVFEKDQFSPDDFLGRTEVPVATIKKEMESKGAANRRLLLHEVPTGEVWVKLDLQLYEPTK
ncbi:intersectin-2a isoform X1 [Epinephelus fuscoguttatus]|uniref:intersectin-2a isoform X1 n=1 Tax=Epinephelus fuscoguttatus TaxID=293821 RepID=UPI0020D17AC2|nr:intersectin-2a isoform X1 [Epinephelus fuscoguttatus]XP_049445678.1 intersectin-2a isoform X1 [Epinephelus fuscoguttatus]